MIGTKISFERLSEVKSTIGPSAPPTIAIEALSLGLNPIEQAIGSTANVPSSAHSARNMLCRGFASTKLMSSIVPMPMKIRQAISPLLNMKV